MAADTFNIEVCYASDAVQFLRALRVPQGTTIEQAIAISGVLQEAPEIDLATMQVMGTYPAPGGPDCMDVMAGGRYLMTTSPAGNAGLNQLLSLKIGSETHLALARSLGADSTVLAGW